MPQVAGGPEGLNELLERVYNRCIKGGGSESRCSQGAWRAAKNAGWRRGKDGKWRNGDSDLLRGNFRRRGEG